jgi:hypothetical protein
MKTILTSAGLLALGAVGLQAAYAPGLTRLETTKPWSLSASLRGFYDDNYATARRHLREDSFGFEVSPSASLNLLPTDQTYLGASYTYSMRYYEARPRNSADHSHIFSGKLDHAFSERYRIELSDTFVYAQEPSLIHESLIDTPIRTEGDVLRNTANVDFHAQLTTLLGTRLGYRNTILDYDHPVRSALLDRMMHRISADARYQVLPQTIAVLGYAYGIVDYNGNRNIGLRPGGGFYRSADRDNTSHYIYVGADQSFSPNLRGSVRLGAQYTEWDKLNEDQWSPYADANLTYTYLPGSYVQFGAKHERQATDIIGNTLAGLTLDQEATSIYASLSHQITAKLTGSLLGQYQHSTFESGDPFVDGASEDFFIAGVNLAYRINPNFLAEAGYNYDKLNSDFPRSFTRNRVYIGIRATY